jgi:hypothetical protein
MPNGASRDESTPALRLGRTLPLASAPALGRAQTNQLAPFFTKPSFPAIRRAKAVREHRSRLRS